MPPHKLAGFSLGRRYGLREGAQHLAAALEAVATMSPACLRCQSSHVCSVRDDSAKIPLCVSDPEGSLPLWMPWTNADVQARVDPIYAQVDALHEKISRLQAQLAQAERVVVPELDGAPVLQEELADNGGHSHWNLFDSGSGALLWTEAPEEEWHKHHRRPTHSVPASRVLKDGEVAVGRDDLVRVAGQWEKTHLDSIAHTLAKRQSDRGIEEVRRLHALKDSPCEACSQINALRAQGKEGAP